MFYTFSAELLILNEEHWMWRDLFYFISFTFVPQNESA